ncbi:MAG: hypothetical protein ACHBN1_11330 [Heteroscytonema crispum UTEX LB 1556]
MSKAKVSKLYPAFNPTEDRCISIKEKNNWKLLGVGCWVLVGGFLPKEPLTINHQQTPNNYLLTDFYF